MLITKEKPALNLYDRDAIKWENDGKKYCLYIQHDDAAESPRFDRDNAAIITCWHHKYMLGDEINYKEPSEFWKDLVRESVSDDEIYAMAEAGKLADIRIAKNEKAPELLDVYETHHYICHQNEKNVKEECIVCKGIDRNEVVRYLLETLTVQQCVTLMKPHAEWLPLWLYDHSGITLSCGERCYPYNDQLDSGWIGWVVCLKKTVAQLYGEIDDEKWRQIATEIMKEEVNVYDQYLRGEIYGFRLYEEDTRNGESLEWNEIDSCWGFYGEDIFENGMCCHVGFGLEKAIQANEYATGKLKVYPLNYRICFE